MSDFHIVVIFNDFYTQIIAFFDQTDAEQKQKQTCCKPTLISWKKTHTFATQILMSFSDHIFV